MEHFSLFSHFLFRYFHFEIWPFAERSFVVIENDFRQINQEIRHKGCAISGALVSSPARGFIQHRRGVVLDTFFKNKVRKPFESAGLPARRAGPEAFRRARSPLLPCPRQASGEPGWVQPSPNQPPGKSLIHFCPESTQHQHDDCTKHALGKIAHLQRQGTQCWKITTKQDQSVASICLCWNYPGPGNIILFKPVASGQHLHWQLSFDSVCKTRPNNPQVLHDRGFCVSDVNV